MMKQAWQTILWPINALASCLLIAMVWIYRWTLGWFMGGQCRFNPTCSQYMLDAVAKHGPWRGGWRGIKRICRCHPWGGSGHDPA
jgi:putative membrane protein insertion efficiency factor